MRIRQLVELLSGFDQELNVDINIRPSADKLDWCRLRDVVDERTHKHQQTIVQLVGDYRDHKGQYWPFLDDAEKLARKEEIMRKLKDRGHYRFTSIHGDFRIYSPSGMNDTCYGTAYDPRLFLELEEEDNIKKTHAPMGYGHREYVAI